jgi:hypothetical protein
MNMKSDDTIKNKTGNIGSLMSAKVRSCHVRNVINIETRYNEVYEYDVTSYIYILNCAFP